MQIVVMNPAFTAVEGFLVGHFWTIRRDRRKEFNEIAIPICVTIMKQIKLLESGDPIGAYFLISDDEFNYFKIHLPTRKANKYQKDLAYYRQCEEACTYGATHAENLTNFIKACNKLLSYAKRK